MRVNDLVPVASGRAAIGWQLGSKDNQIGPDGITVQAILPFFTFHCLSGIFHDPLGGQSGVIRYTRRASSPGNPTRFEKSIDGGRTFTALFGNGDVTLQNAYEKGFPSPSPYSFNGIICEASPGNLTILGQGQKFSIVPNSGIFPVQVSGFFTMSFGGTTAGDINMLFHSITSGVPLPHNQNTGGTIPARRKSFGIGTMVLNTGSGLANISIGSGFFQAMVDAAININVDSQSGTLIYTTSNFDDLNYGAGSAPTSSSSGSSFVIFSPGLYECSYNISFDHTAGSSERLLKCQVFRNIGEPLSASTSYAFSSSSSFGECSCGASFLFEAKAGDRFGIYAGFTGTSDSANTASTIANEGYVMVRKIGSRRHEASVVGL